MSHHGAGVVKKNAIAGRSFTSWEAFEAHLAKWELEVSNARLHGTTGEAPIARFELDEAHRLKPLGGRPSFGSLRELTRIVGNDCAVEIDTNSYSVPWRLIGERVAVTVAAGEVRIRHGVREVAVHKQSQGRRLRVVDSADLAGVAGRDGAVRRALIGSPACRRRPFRPRCCVHLPSMKQRSEGASDGTRKETEAPTDPLEAMLARLHLTGIRDQLDSLLDEAVRADLSARETHHARQHLRGARREPPRGDDRPAGRGPCAPRCGADARHLNPDIHDLRGRPVVIGAGVAGLTTALHLAQEPVVLLSKAPLEAQASSTLAQGGLAASLGAPTTARTCNLPSHSPPATDYATRRQSGASSKPRQTRSRISSACASLSTEPSMERCGWGSRRRIRADGSSTLQATAPAASWSERWLRRFGGRPRSRSSRG